jgi:hypothetical protein
LDAGISGFRARQRTEQFVSGGGPNPARFAEYDLVASYETSAGRRELRAGLTNHPVHIILVDVLTGPAVVDADVRVLEDAVTREEADAIAADYVAQSVAAGLPLQTRRRR